MNKKNVFYVGMYLLAIVLANLLVAQFGKISVLWVGFLFIGFDLTARDKLHEAWNGDRLIVKMGLLIASGSILSWFINRNAGLIAIASFTAFGSAAIVDTLVYQLLHKQDYLLKVNGSNIVSAMVDSLVFPTIAFGGFLPSVTLGQFAVKVLGGMVWVWLISSRCQLGFHKWYDISITHRKCSLCQLEDTNYNPYSEV